MNLDPSQVNFCKSIWSKARVPIRPGSEGLALYRAQMERCPGKNILVLGATPELVDMALELNAKKIVSVEKKSGGNGGNETAREKRLDEGASDCR